jgi:xylan 1,4-beta-xylosidase
MKNTLLLFLLFFSTALEASNPILPGYFADPTVKKFGDTYYLYATTDGIKLGSGQPQVWISKDFVNWYNYELKIRLPEGLNNCWAPDVVHAQDGKYYYFMGNCERGCNIYGYVSDSPMGPFTPVNNGVPVIPAGIPKKGFPSLDAQMMVDDDGSVYSYFGTWCSSFGGIGFAKIDPKDMHSIITTSQIPMSEVPRAFEASYPMKRKDKYFLMYSSGDCRLSSYAVHYSVSDKPEGPFTPGKNNPILATTTDGSVDGPGHHSVLQEGNAYYIVYHRHDNPHSTNGEFRQVCVDKMVFSDSVTIEKVVPTNSGSFFTDLNPTNLAFNASATASSSYHLVSNPTPYSKAGYDYTYVASNVVDDDNGTLWKAASSTLPQSLTIDLGKVQPVKRILTQFEYPTYYYQYKLEVSSDNKHWVLFSDKTNNRRAGSPMIDDKSVTAQFVRLTVTGTEKTGVLPAVWNLKVYDRTFETPAFANEETLEGPGVPSSNSLLVDFKVDAFKEGSALMQVPNKGKLGGIFSINGQAAVTTVDGVKAATFDGKSYFQLSKKAPMSLNWNAPYTAAVWVYNPTIEMGECLMAWNTRDNMLQGTYAALMYGTGNYGAVAHGDGAVDLHYKGMPENGKWHHIVVTFDGALENVYVDGKLNTQLPISLYVERGDVFIGSSGADWENFSGSIASARLYDKALSTEEVNKLMTTTKPKK